MTEKYPDFISLLSFALENNNNEIFIFSEKLFRELSTLEKVVKNIDRRVEDIENKLHTVGSLCESLEKFINK